MSKALKNRMVVELIGLKKTELNGKIGILWCFVTDKCRWKVLVEKESCYLLIKPENIKEVESYKSPDGTKSDKEMRPNAWEVWAEPDSSFTVQKIKTGGEGGEVPLMGLLKLPFNVSNPNTTAERAWLQKARHWKDPQGFNPVDGFFTDGGKDGKYLYYDNGDNTSPINYWANHVMKLTPHYRLQQLPCLQDGGIHGNVIVMSSPHMGHQFKTYNAAQLRKWMRGLCTEDGEALSQNNTPGSAASIASMWNGAGGMPTNMQNFFCTTSGSSQKPF